MAKQGLKKRADENARRLQLLGIAIAVANVSPGACMLLLHVQLG